MAQPTRLPDPDDLIERLRLLAYDAREYPDQDQALEKESLSKALSLYVTSDEIEWPLYLQALNGHDQAFEKITSDNNEDLLMSTPSSIDFSAEYDLASSPIGRLIGLVIGRQMKIADDLICSDTPTPMTQAQPELEGWRWRP